MHLLVNKNCYAEVMIRFSLHRFWPFQKKKLI